MTPLKSPLVRGGTCSRCSLNSFTPSLPWSGIVFISPALHPNGTDRGPGPLIFRRASKLNVGGALRRGNLSTLFHIPLGRQNSRLKPAVGDPGPPYSKKDLARLAFNTNLHHFPLYTNRLSALTALGNPRNGSFNRLQKNSTLDTDEIRYIMLRI